MKQLDRILDRFLLYGTTTASIIQSSPVRVRPPPLPDTEKTLERLLADDLASCLTHKFHGRIEPMASVALSKGLAAPSFLLLRRPIMVDRTIPLMREPEKRFATLVGALAQEPGVTTPDQAAARGFGSSALKVNGSIFAMLTRGQLVVKLPRDRVNALVEAGSGASFDAGKGTPMKEWLTVVDNDEERWLALAREALGFVGRRS